MYTDSSPGRASCAAAIQSKTSGTCWRALDVAAARPGTPTRWKCRRSRRGDARARAACRRRRRPGDALVVIHVSASSPFRRWPLPSFVETAAALATTIGRRVVVTSGPSEHEAVEARHRATRGRGCRKRRDAGCSTAAISRSPNCARCSSGVRCTSGATAARCTSPRRPACRLSPSFGPTPSERSAPWRDPAIPSALIEVDGLPCRPCDQRVCEPGDFRCLTRIDAARVVEAAERLLEGRRSAVLRSRSNAL